MILKLKSTWVVFLITFTVGVVSSPAYIAAQTDDIYESSEAFGVDLKQEKEDETFFYFGRFLMAGLGTGVRTFTGNLGTIYNPGFEVSGSTYFFTLGFAAELLTQYSWHEFVVDNVSGNIALLNVNLSTKYYITSTQFTRALVYANPYIMAGVGQYFRFYNSSQFPASGKENALGFNIGGGFEFPVKERVFYIGLRFLYHWIFFKDENQTSSGGTPLDGDALSFLATFSYNF